MIVGSLLVGLLFIGIGFLNALSLKRYPNVNVFCSAIPTEKKKDVDIAGLVAFTKKGFFSIGAMIIVLPFILKLFHIEEVNSFLIPFMVLGGTFLVYIKSVKYYNYNERNYKLYIYILFGIIIFIAILLRLAIEYTKR